MLVIYLGFMLLDLTSRGFEGETPDNWIHKETTPSFGHFDELEFKFFWVRLDEVPELQWDHGALLHKLH